MTRIKDMTKSTSPTRALEKTVHINTVWGWVEMGRPCTTILLGHWLGSKAATSNIGCSVEFALQKDNDYFLVWVCLMQYLGNAYTKIQPLFISNANLTGCPVILSAKSGNPRRGSSKTCMLSTTKLLCLLIVGSHPKNSVALARKLQ